MKDITNERFGNLTAIRNTGRKDIHRNYIWLCQCDCGNFCEVVGNNLRTGHTKSCGCLRQTVCAKVGKQQNIIEETGNTYGYLSVIEFAYIKKQVAYWKCKCKCGNEVIVAGNHLRSGHTKSCGCINSIGEFIINQILSENNINYLTQYTVRSPNNGYYRFDFVLLDDDGNIRRFIEFDGEQHYESKCSQYYGDFEEIHKRDLEKNEYCKNNNIPLVRIPYWERYNLTLDMIIGNKYLI